VFPSAPLWARAMRHRASFLYGGTPMLVALAAALLFSRHPLSREVYADVQAQLAARRPGGP